MKKGECKMNIRKFAKVTGIIPSTISEFEPAEVITYRVDPESLKKKYSRNTSCSEVNI